MDTRDPDVVLQRRVAAGEAVLIAQPLPDPLRRVPLLRRCRLVCREDRVDHGDQRPELGMIDRLRPYIVERRRCSSLFIKQYRAAVIFI
jgi:hypothetical protein